MAEPKEMFQVTVLPATRWAKECWVVSYKPGTPKERVVDVATQLQRFAMHREAGFVVLWDTAVVAPTSLQGAFWLWLRGKARVGGLRRRISERRGRGA